MIDYDSTGFRQITFVFQVRGSVFPFGLCVALPCAAISAGLKALTLHGGASIDLSGASLLATGGGTAAWSGFTFLVGFVVVFRTSQAYGRFWDALNDTHKMLAEWFDAASSIAAFTRGSKREEQTVDNFLHTAMRLFSILSASALQELSDIRQHQIVGLQTLDASAIDSESVSTLDGSPCRVELVYQWIQQLLVDAVQSGLICVPPPIVGRSFAELSAGMTKFHDAMKHAKIPFPFPYAQTTMFLLIFHWLLTPCVMTQWSNGIVGSFVFTFVQVFTLWSLNAIATIFERPFLGQQNDIDPHELQQRINRQLINLVEPKTRKTPFIHASSYCDIDTLRKRDTIHAAALIGEGWELKTVEAVDPDDSSTARSWFPSRLGRQRAARAAGPSSRAKVAVSERYCQKRYGIVDGEKTAVLTVGIFGDDLVVALPESLSATAGGGSAEGDRVVCLQNLRGEACKLRMKKVPIQHRHGLSKVADRSWLPGEYLDFPLNYSFHAEDLVIAFHQEGSKADARASAVAAPAAAADRLYSDEEADREGQAGLCCDMAEQLEELTATAQAHDDSGGAAAAVSAAASVTAGRTGAGGVGAVAPGAAAEPTPAAPSPLQDPAAPPSPERSLLMPAASFPRGDGEDDLTPLFLLPDLPGLPGAVADVGRPSTGGAVVADASGTSWRAAEALPVAAPPLLAASGAQSTVAAAAVGAKTAPAVDGGVAHASATGHGASGVDGAGAGATSTVASAAVADVGASGAAVSAVAPVGVGGGTVVPWGGADVGTTVCPAASDAVDDGAIDADTGGDEEQADSAQCALASTASLSALRSSAQLDDLEEDERALASSSCRTLVPPGDPAAEDPDVLRRELDLMLARADSTGRLPDLS
eukprot:TRINITY_DN71336_c0_g1_i1.p1 TRINITY_DN71336_c0_g1~~TRINITY_DN71336_c0_g1_i1.p1  ORF type:complete len:874 (+),score=202.84 TRINITY_DN71336_c0_g1_i1:66-2687(+)